MDYHLFLEEAAIDGKIVEIETKQGEKLQAYPLYLDEADDNYLGYIFETPEGDLTGIFFKDMKSVKIIEQSLKTVLSESQLAVGK